MLAAFCLLTTVSPQTSSVSVRSFGAKGDGVTDDSRAFNAAISSGKTEIVVPAGKYVVGDSLLIRASNISLKFEKGAVLTGGDPKVTLIDVRGSEPTNRVPLNSAAGRGRATFQLPTSISAPVGTWLEFRSEAVLPDVPNKFRKRRMQLVRVNSVSQGKVTLDVPLAYDFLPSDGATVGVAKMLENVTISGLKATGPFFRGIRWSLASGKLTNIDISRNRVSESQEREAACGIAFADAVNVDVWGVRATHLDWYGIGIDGASREIEIRRGYFEDTRHAVSVNWSGQYGEPSQIKVADSNDVNSRLSGFDTHDVGRDIVFLRCVSRGAGDCGFQTRTSFVTFDRCKVFGAKLDGIIARPTDPNNPPSHIQVINSEASDNGRFGIHLPGDQNVIQSVVCRRNHLGNTGGGGILIGGGTVDDADITDSGTAIVHGDPGVPKAWEVTIRNLRAPKSAKQTTDVVPSKLAGLRRG